MTPLWHENVGALARRPRARGAGVAPTQFSPSARPVALWDSRNRVRMALKHLAWHELPRFIVRDAPYYLRLPYFKDYFRYWWSTLTDKYGVRELLRYRWQHRGEPLLAFFRTLFRA